MSRLDLSDPCERDRDEDCRDAWCEHHCHHDQEFDPLHGWQDLGDEYDPALAERPMVTLAPVGGVL